MSTSDAKAVVRRPYTGGCHCGFIKYIVYLSIPTDPDFSMEFEQFNALKQLVYKCNCTICQKSGCLHVRPPNAPTDFMLLQPEVDADGRADGLGEYRCNTKKENFTFCTKCGVRCFIYICKWETATVQLPGLETSTASTVSRPTDVLPEGPKEMYLSINMHTLDAKQAGLDLREWHERGWIGYMNYFDDDPKLTIAERIAMKPFSAGVY